MLWSCRCAGERNKVGWGCGEGGAERGEFIDNFDSLELSITSQEAMLDLSRDSAEEERLTRELHSLDHRLQTRPRPPAPTAPHRLIHDHSAPSPHALLHRLPAPSPLTQLAHIDYFSEIGNHDLDEDSLFEQGGNFLGQSGQYGGCSRVGRNANEGGEGQKREKEEGFSLDDETPEDELWDRQTHILEILKEQDYIFRKEKPEPPQLAKKSTHQPHKSCLPKPPPRPKSTLAHPSAPPKGGRSVQAASQDDCTLSQPPSQQTLHNYLFLQSECSNSWQPQQRLKTEESRCNFRTIEQYCEQALAGRNGHTQICKTEYDSRSKSRGRGRGGAADHDKNSLECTFKPKILKKSQQLVRSSQEVGERLGPKKAVGGQRLPYQPAKPAAVKPSMQRIEQLSQPRKPKRAEEQEEVPCFRPSLSKKSLDHMSNCTYDVATRNRLWLEQREEKLERLRREEEEERQRREESSHSPHINQYRGEQEAQFSQFGRQGMLQYFERVSQARKRNSVAGLKKDDSQIFSRDYPDESIRTNKENEASLINRDKPHPKPKKQTYEEAVRQLHSKIMKLKI